MSQTLELKRNSVQLLLERLIYAIFLAAPPPCQHIPVTAGTIIYPLLPYYYNTRLYRQPRP